MVFNATFNNISAIPWRSVLLVEETGVPRENHRLVASYRQTVFLQEFTLFRKSCVCQISFTSKQQQQHTLL